MMTGLKPAVLFNVFFFFFRNTFHLRWIIPEPRVTHKYPEYPDYSVNEESRTPPVSDRDGNYNQRSNGCTNIEAKKNRRKTSCGFRLWKPVRNNAATIGKGARFAHSKKESNKN